MIAMMPKVEQQQVQVYELIPNILLDWSLKV